MVPAARLGLSLLCTWAMAGCALRGADTRRWTPDFNVHREVFDNGLTVLFVEDRSIPVVSYATWFKVGSAWEKEGATGIAHLFEHMMFKGTPRFGAKQFFQTLEGKGALINAFTQRDATVYYEVIASKYLETVIDMEADRLANLAFTQADLDAERQVVKDERRLRVDSNFAAQHAEELQRLAFPGHPYGRPIIGYQRDLDRLSLEQCREFFRSYYNPRNAVVTIAGDVDYRQARKWIQQYYGRIPGGPGSELRLAETPRKRGEKRASIRRPVQAESLLMAYYIPSMYSPDADKLSMLSWALFGMSSSRASLRLVRERQIALAVGADADLERFPHLFVVSADMKSGIAAAEAEREIDLIIDEVRTTPVSEEELARVKNAVIYHTVNESKSPAGLASWLAGGEFYWGDHRRAIKQLEAFHAMTANDLTDVARKYLVKENRVVVVMRPKR